MRFALVLQAGEQALEEALRRGRIPAVLDQNIEHHAVLIHRAPEVVQLAVDLQEHLILSAKSEVLKFAEAWAVMVTAVERYGPAEAGVHLA